MWVTFEWLYLWSNTLANGKTLLRFIFWISGALLWSNKSLKHEWLFISSWQSLYCVLQFVFLTIWAGRFVSGLILSLLQDISCLFLWLGILKPLGSSNSYEKLPCRKCQYVPLSQSEHYEIRCMVKFIAEFLFIYLFVFC